MVPVLFCFIQLFQVDVRFQTLSQDSDAKLSFYFTFKLTAQTCRARLEQEPFSEQYPNVEISYNPTLQLQWTENLHCVLI